MGAATALYSATCFAMGRYGNGLPYTLNLRAVIGLSGWLPGSRYISKLLFKRCLVIYVHEVYVR